MNKTTNQIIMVPVEKLVPYANNARTHTPEQILKLRASIREPIAGRTCRLIKKSTKNRSFRWIYGAVTRI